jgi:predicted DNA-binding antitoxin AbrB/MazE fold protein
MRPIEAFYEDGQLKLKTPLPLRQGEHVGVVLLRYPDPKRWNLERLAKVGRDEDLALAEQGLAQWCDALDAEDQS